MTSYPAPVAFIFSNNKSRTPFTMQGSRHFVRCKDEVSPVMKALDWSFFHWGDRCDRLTRSKSTGCLLKGLTVLLGALHGPSHLSGPFLALSYIPSAPSRPSLTGPCRILSRSIVLFWLHVCPDMHGFSLVLCGTDDTSV